MRPSMQTWLSLVCLLAPGLAGCQSDDGPAGSETANDDAPVIEVDAVEYAFVAPDSVPSGWLSVRLDNTDAKEAHQITLTRLPAGRTMEDVGRDVLPYYDSIFTLVERGEIGSVNELGKRSSEMSPEWWGEENKVITDQGVLSAGRSARKTVYLEPGTYMLACYVRAPNGKPHLVQGMIRELVVTNDSTGASPPEADVEIAVAGDSVRSPDTIRAGDITVRARLGETEERNTVHLVRADSGVDPDEVKQWRRVWTPDGRQSPEPTEFLGGHALFGNTPAEWTATFTAEDVEPGRYAWLVSGFIGRTENAIWEPVVVE